MIAYTYVRFCSLVSYLCVYTLGLSRGVHIGQVEGHFSVRGFPRFVVGRGSTGMQLKRNSHNIN
jgi:hypothetical protein